MTFSIVQLRGRGGKKNGGAHKFSLLPLQNTISPNWNEKWEKYFDKTTPTSFLRFWLLFIYLFFFLLFLCIVGFLFFVFFFFVFSFFGFVRWWVLLLFLLFFLNFYFYYFFKKMLLDDFLFYFLKCPLLSVHNFKKKI